MKNLFTQSWIPMIVFFVIGILLMVIASATENVKFGNAGQISFGLAFICFVILMVQVYKNRKNTSA